MKLNRKLWPLVAATALLISHPLHAFKIVIAPKLATHPFIQRLDNTSPAPIQQVGFYYQPYVRILDCISFDGQEIIMDNGAVLGVSSQYANDVLHFWRPGDPITLSPSSFPGYVGFDYFITNQRTNTYAYVKFKMGPSLNAPTTTTIANIDTYNYRVSISSPDGSYSTWKYTPADHYYVKNWRVGQGIIVGVNQGALSYFSSHENILLNINLAEHISATIQ